MRLPNDELVTKHGAIKWDKMARHCVTIHNNNNNNNKQTNQSSPPSARRPSSLDTTTPPPDLTNTLSVTDTLNVCGNNSSDTPQPSASVTVSAAVAADDRSMPPQYDMMVTSFDDIAFDIAAASQQLQDIESRIPDLSYLPDLDRMLDEIVSSTASDSFQLPPPPQSSSSIFRWSQFSSSAAAAVIPDDEWTELTGRYDDEQLAAIAASCFGSDEDPSTAVTVPMSADASRNFDPCRLPTLMDLEFDDRCRTAGMRWELIGCVNPSAGAAGQLTGEAVCQSLLTKEEHGSMSSSDDMVELVEETCSEWIDASRDSVSYGSVSEYNGGFPAAITDSSWHYIPNCPDHHHQHHQQQQRLYGNGQMTTVANTAVYRGMTSSPVRNRPVSVNSVDSGCSSSLADCLTLLTPDSCCSNGDCANYRWEEQVESDVMSRSVSAHSPLTGGRPSTMSSGSCAVLSTTATSAPAAAVKQRRGRSGKPRRSVCLWQFLRELLHVPQLYESSIRWIDRNGGIFKIEDSVRVAKLWGECKNRPAMNYDKLSRSIRQYYKQGIIRKTNKSRRLVFQFCPQYL